MKRLIYILFSVTLLLESFSAKAVTDKEMEQARVIATQTYLRYANDGSDYLDALHPKTMAELESKLKNKEKENIKAFKAIPVPKDYASWDKAKLVEYWSTTAFASKGLTDKGKIGKARAKKKLNNMTVAAPAPKNEQAAAPATDKPAQDPAPKAEEPKKTETPVADAAPAENPELGIDSTNIAIEEQQAMAQAALDAEDEGQIKKVKNNTWIYVVILIILVGVVVALVVFASNVMKRNSGNSTPSGSGNPASSSNEKALRGKLKAMAAQLEEANRENDQLQKQVDALTAELASLRKQRQTEPRPVSQATQSAASRPAPENRYPAPTPTPARPVTAAATATSAPSAKPAAGRTGSRTIYLGRANAKGIFVRADRNLNPGNSIFRLDTTDGFAGSFRVVNDPSVIEKVQQNPLAELANACIGPDLDDPDGLETIVTDSAGTAIFESGCWKVSRKAKIHYE